MTVSSQTSSETYLGNGVTMIWDLPFRFFQNSDIQVYLTNPSTSTTTQLVLGTDYTLTGEGLPEQFGTAPGKITTTVAVPVTWALEVFRVMPIEQLTDIINQGEFFPEIHEDVFDRLTMMMQQVGTDASRALRMPVGKNYYDALGHQIKNLGDPTAAQDAATKNYVDVQNNAQDARIDALSAGLPGTNHAFPWSTVTTESTKVLTPGYEFSSATLAIDGATQSYGKSYAISGNQILLAEAIPAGTEVSAILGQYVLPEGFVTFDELKANATFLRPEWYGAVDSALIDSTEAIRNCHIAANAIRKPVSYSGLKNVLIEANAQIVINTDVDFTGCLIAVRNGILPSPSQSTIQRMFLVKEPVRPFINLTLDVSELKYGCAKITVPENIGSGYLHINSNKPIGKRTTDLGTDLFYQQGFAIYRGGVLNRPLNEDLSANTVTAIFWPNPEYKIEIKGICADESTYNNQSILRIERNLVDVVSPVGQPKSANTLPISTNYEVWFVNSAFSALSDGLISPFTTYDNSTYGISFINCAEIELRDMEGKGTASWGVMHSEHVNGLRIANCDLNRFDIHQGAHNVFVVGGSLDGNPLQYGWGGGVMDMDGVSIIGNTPAMRARTDYDNNFRGSISIRGIKVYLPNIVPDGGTGKYAVAPIFEGTKIGTVDAIGLTKFCENFLIDDVEYLHNGATDIIVVRPVDLNTIDFASGVMFPNRFTVRNVRTAGRRMLFTFDGNLQRFKASTSGRSLVEFDSISSGVNATYPFINRGNPVSGWDVSGSVYDFDISNCKGFSSLCAAPSHTMRVRGSEISSIRAFSGSSSNQRLQIYDSELISGIALGGGASGEIGAGAAQVIARDFTVRSNGSFNVLTAAQGVLVEASLTFTFPGGATFATAFTGFKTAAFQ